MLHGVALVVGIIAGLSAFTAPTAASWAARRGARHLDRRWLAFMCHRHRRTPWVFSGLAVTEQVCSQLTSTPSRVLPIPFGANPVSGAPYGATIGASGGTCIGASMAGVIVALIGTCGGAAARARMATAFGRDLPAALVEDTAAIILGTVVIPVLR